MKNFNEILPESLSLDIDGVHLPWYNLSIHGGVEMSTKNKSLTIDNKKMITTENVITRGIEAIGNIYAENQISKRNEDEGYVRIIENSDIPSEIRVVELEERRTKRKEDRMHKTAIILTIAILSAGVIFYGETLAYKCYVQTRVVK